MADFSEWGGGGGISSAIADQHTIAQTGLTQAQTAMSQAQLPYVPGKMYAETLNALAQAGLHTADAGLKQEALMQTRAMSQAMKDAMAKRQSSGVADSTDPTDLFIDMAGGMVRSALSVGATNDAQHWSSALNQAVGHKNTALETAAKAAREELLGQTQAFDLAARQVDMISALPLDRQVEAYNMMNRHFAQQGKKPVPWADLQWSPQTAELIKQGALSQKEKANQDYKDTLLDLKEQALREKIRYDQQLVDARKTTADLQRERDEAKAKLGGKDVGMPSKTELDLARAVVLQNYPDLKSMDLSTISTDIAAQAKWMRTKRPGAYTLEQSINKTFMENKDKIETTVAPPKTFLGMDIPGTGGEKTSQYVGNTIGKTPELALPAPSNVKDFVPNRYYLNPQGKVYQWAKKPDGTYGGKLVGAQ